MKNYPHWIDFRSQCYNKRKEFIEMNEDFDWKKTCKSFDYSYFYSTVIFLEERNFFHDNFCKKIKGFNAFLGTIIWHSREIIGRVDWQSWYLIFLRLDFDHDGASIEKSSYIRSFFITSKTSVFFLRVCDKQ